MRVQALEAAGAAGAADAELERRAAVAADPALRELPAPGPLFVVGAVAALGQNGVVGRGARPALDAARRLEPRDRGDEVRGR